MAVLFITHKFPPSVGGMQKQSFELINGVRKAIKSFTIVQRPQESKFFFFLMLRKRVKKVLRHNPEISVVHCNDGLCAMFCAWLLAYEKIILTTTIHGLDIVYPGRWFQKYFVAKLRRFDKIFAVSDATAKACISRGISSSKVSVIPNGVDAEMAHIAKDTKFAITLREKYGIDIRQQKIVLSVGRAVKRKGFLWFANEVLTQLDEDTNYVVIGPSVANLNAISRVIKLLPKSWSEHVKLLTGFPEDLVTLKKIENPKLHILHDVPYNELVQWMSYADLFVMPNISIVGDMEGFGLVALEAGLRGAQVVASELEGITSAVHQNNNGLLLKHEDAGLWYSKIKALLSDRRQLEINAVETKAYVLEHFSWDKMSAAYIQELKILMEKSTIKESQVTPLMMQLSTI